MVPLTRRVFSGGLVAALASRAGRTYQIPVRRRVQSAQGEWKAVDSRQEVDPAKTAVVICDMWDRHWCSAAGKRVDTLAHKMAPVVDKLRDAGILIIHAPSETMRFYSDMPQRKRMMEAAKIAFPAQRELPDPPLPIDDKSGGCDSKESSYQAWTRQHPAIRIGPQDGISDRADEIYSVVRGRGGDTLIFMGVHTNMCVLTRWFAIKNMVRWGMRVVLVRDLTDAMYDPADAPFVSHDAGTQLVVEHIERFWCPTVLSQELVQALS
jgi:nicotinamidase-related amidase